MKKNLTFSKLLMLVIMAVLPLSMMAQKEVGNKNMRPAEKYWYIQADGGLSINHGDLASYNGGIWGDWNHFKTMALEPTWNAHFGIGYQFGKVVGLNVKGELQISEHGASLQEIWLEPVNAKPLRDVLDAVDDADVILLGPGSLFTSVIPNLLLPDFAKKIRDSQVPKIYICNLMTQPEETQDMNIVQHLKWVSAALGCVPDFVIVNSEPIPEDIIQAYKLDGASPLYLDYHQREEIKNMGCVCVETPTALVSESEKGRFLRHDPQKLASVLFKIFRKSD